MTLNHTELAEHAAEAMLEKKAQDIRIIDLRNLTAIVDYFVICSADSEPQMKAIVDQVTGDLKARHTRPWHVEGTRGWRWVLVDYVDVVVHVFREETRTFYGLERLWGDAPITQVSIDPESGQIRHITDCPPEEEVVHE